MKPLRLLLVPVTLGLLLASVGCGGGPSGVKVQGKLTDAKGADVTFAATETVQLSLVSPAFSAAAVVNKADGSFRVEGPEGRGLPPGDYTVTLEAKPYGPMAGNKADRFRGKFAPGKSPLKVTVPAKGVDTVTVDIERGVVRAS